MLLISNALLFWRGTSLSNGRRNSHKCTNILCYYRPSPTRRIILGASICVYGAMYVFSDIHVSGPGSLSCLLLPNKPSAFAGPNPQERSEEGLDKRRPSTSCCPPTC